MATSYNKIETAIFTYFLVFHSKQADCLNTRISVFHRYYSNRIPYSVLYIVTSSIFASCRYSNLWRVSDYPNTQPT